MHADHDRRGAAARALRDTLPLRLRSKGPPAFDSEDALDLAARVAGKAATAAAQPPANAAAALERELAQWLGFPHAVLFDAPWSASFAATSSAAAGCDYLLLDEASGIAVERGARSITPGVLVYAHRAVDDVHAMLCELSSRPERPRLVVGTPSFFTGTSEPAELCGLRALCRQYGAGLMVVCGADLATRGRHGGGELERQGLAGDVELLVGSLEGALVARGGFVCARDPELAARVRAAPGAHDARTPDPRHTRVEQLAALDTVRLARHAEGSRRRIRLLRASAALRGALERDGARCLGQPSCEVPVVASDDRVARRARSLLQARGLRPHWIPSDPRRGRPACLSLRVTAAHSPRQAAQAGAAVAHCLQEARDQVALCGG